MQMDVRRLQIVTITTTTTSTSTSYEVLQKYEALLGGR